MIIWVLLLFLAVILYDRITLLRTAEKREKVLYFILMGISFVPLILHSVGIPVSFPANGIMKVLDTVFHIKG